MNSNHCPADNESWLRVSIPRQTIELFEQGVAVREWPVSTAKNGPGEQRGSECTPRGWHRIRARIGEGEPVNAVFRGRRPTGELYGEALERDHPGRDWILTRILWLGGLEPGFNRYGAVDSAWRYIYVHGSPDRGVSGEPASHGCVRLRGTDMLELFELARTGMKVLIEA